MSEPKPITEYRLSWLIQRWGLASVPLYSPVGSKYGAPMGRWGTMGDEINNPIIVPPPPVSDSGYDLGGAYWGHQTTHALWDPETGATLYFDLTRFSDYKSVDDYLTQNEIDKDRCRYIHDVPEYAEAIDRIKRLLDAEQQAEADTEDSDDETQVVYMYHQSVVDHIENGGDYSSDDDTYWHILNGVLYVDA